MTHSSKTGELRSADVCYHSVRMQNKIKLARHNPISKTNICLYSYSLVAVLSGIVTE